MAFDLAQASGVGKDSISESDKRPFIRILQTQSPECNKRHDKYIEGAECGSLLLASEGRLLPQGIEFIPLMFGEAYVEWVPKNAGGGYKGTHNRSIVTDPRYEKGRINQYSEHLGENELKWTKFLALLIVEGDKTTPACIAFDSTKLKIARKLEQAIANFRYEDNPEIDPAIFAQSWKLYSQDETNDSGDFVNFEIKEPRVLDPEADENLLQLSMDTTVEAQDTIGALTTPAQASNDTPALTDESQPY